MNINFVDNYSCLALFPLVRVNAKGKGIFVDKECTSCIKNMHMGNMVWMKRLTLWATHYKVVSGLSSWYRCERFFWYWQWSFCFVEYFTGVKMVRSLATCLAKQLQLNPDEEFALNLAVDEAVTNAWEAQISLGQKDEKPLEDYTFSKSKTWDNPRKVDKPILVKFLLSSDRLRIIVTDGGKGFKIGAHCSIDIMGDHGRGCFFMKTYMDKVTWLPQQGGGTKCIMDKRLPQTFSALLTRTITSLSCDHSLCLSKVNRT